MNSVFNGLIVLGVCGKYYFCKGRMKLGSILNFGITLLIFVIGLFAYSHNARMTLAYSIKLSSIAFYILCLLFLISDIYIFIYVRKHMANVKDAPIYLTNIKPTSLEDVLTSAKVLFDTDKKESYEKYKQALLMEIKQFSPSNKKSLKSFKQIADIYKRIGLADDEITKLEAELMSLHINLYNPKYSLGQEYALRKMNSYINNLPAFESGIEASY